MAKDSKLRVKKFNGQNYQLWKICIEDYLYQKDLYLPLGGKLMKPESIIDPAWEILNMKALGFIRLCLATLMVFNILKEKNRIGLMTTLDKLYEKPSTSSKVFLMKHLFNMKMVEVGYVANHLNEFNMMTSQVIYVNFNFDDEVRALLILCSLSESWNGLVMVVSNSVSRSNTLKFDDVLSVILSDEMQRKRTCETSGNTLMVENRGRHKERGNSSINRAKSKHDISKSKGRIECWNCERKGHMKKDYWYQKGKEGNGKQEENQEENVAGDVL